MLRSTPAIPAGRWCRRHAEVIGINTAIINGAQGICFAVASNTAQFVLSEIIRHGYVRRAYIGVAGQTAPIPRRHAVVAGVDNKMGALLAQIEPDGPAAKAGLLPGDVVIKLDGVEINGVDDLIRVLDRDRIGRTAVDGRAADGTVARDRYSSGRAQAGGKAVRIVARRAALPLPLWERVDRRRVAAARRVRGLSPRIADPSSGASRHLLPQGEKEERVRRCYRNAASSSSGASAMIMWPAPGTTTVREFGVAAARVLPAFAGVIMSRSPRMKVAGTLTCAAAESAF